MSTLQQHLGEGIRGHLRHNLTVLPVPVEDGHDSEVPPQVRPVEMDDAEPEISRKDTMNMDRRPPRDPELPRAAPRTSANVVPRAENFVLEDLTVNAAPICTTHKSVNGVTPPPQVQL